MAHRSGIEKRYYTENPDNFTIVNYITMNSKVLVALQAVGKLLGSIGMTQNRNEFQFSQCLFNSRLFVNSVGHSH